MNFFLDTTNFYDDPFLKKIYTEKLIQIVEENGFTIYVSRVVLEEAKAQYKKKLDEQIKKVRDTLTEFNQVPNLNPIAFELPTVEQALEQFDKYYEDLQASGIIEIVEYDNGLLPELVKRSINRKKPFTEKKQEFRDAIIWLSYAQLAESEQLEDCILITANINDYAQNDKLHPDLQADSKRFRRFFKNTYGVMHSEELKPYKLNLELQQWVEGHTVTDEMILTQLSEEENFAVINIYIIGIVEDYSPSDVDDDFFDPGYVELTDTTIGKLKTLDFEVVGEDIIVNGNIEVIAYMDASTDMGEGDYYHHGETEITYEVFFTAKYNHQTGTIHSLEIDDHWRTRTRTKRDRLDEMEFDPDEYEQ